MTRDEQQSILAIALMAAFADGGKHDREREELRLIAEALAQAGEPNLPALYRQVLLKQVTIESAAQQLASPELRQLAYEMAVGVCDADGSRGEGERRFLSDLQRQLGLDAGEAERLAADADAIADAPVATPLPTEFETLGAGNPVSGGAGRDDSGSAPLRSGTGSVPPVTPQQAGLATRPSTMTDAKMDRMIVNAAILNGALELLPDSLATMAIIPLQMKLVYGIGKSYGYELDSGHVREFIATAGVGLTSQYFEEAATRLIGGLLRKVGGKMIGGLGRQATSSAMSFATTWALGQVARRYYAEGRTLDPASLKQAFEGMLGEAKTLQARLLPQIQARAQTLDLQQVLQAVRQ